MRLKMVAFSAAALLLGSAALAAEWPQWRGPNFNGSAEATGLPETLDPKSDALWTTTLPGPASSTPVVAGGHVYVGTIERGSRKLLAMCLDAKSGQALWQKTVGNGFESNERNDLGSPSPVTDGQHAWFFYGTGDLVCYDQLGQQLWARNLQKDYGPFHVQWIYSSSPLLFNGKLYIQVLHRSDDSYLLALDPLTGKELWKQPRANEAVGESKESYATPTPLEAGGRSEILLTGGDVVTANDAATGKEIWRAGGWNPQKINHWRIITSVVTAGDMVIACAPKGGPVMAVRDGGSGDVTGTRVAWNTRDFSTDVCVPLVMGGDAYVLEGDRKKLVCIDPATGKKKWNADLGGGSVFRASPTGADGKIYCMNEAGDVWVVSADGGKILSKTALGDGVCHASIVIADAMVTVRTAGKVTAFVKK